MCPDPQILSIYMDGELPSPWKDKMENHLSECSSCREKFENFKRLQELFKKDTSQKRTIVEVERDSAGGVSAENAFTEQELMEASMKKVWQKLESSYHRREKRFRPGSQVQSRNFWQGRLSIPIPAAAAAAVIIALVTAMWIRSTPAETNGYAAIPVEVESALDKSNFILASEEQIPVADINSVLQYLGSDRPDIIIIQLPETRDFFRSGEPVILPADYSRREP